jgi:hypothetical protein
VFKYGSFAIESKKYNKLFIKSTTGQICVFNYSSNNYKILKRKIGEGYTAFITHDEDYVVFISRYYDLLIVNINEEDNKLHYNCWRVINYGIFTFIRKSADLGRYEFMVDSMRGENRKFIRMDIFNKSYQEIQIQEFAITYKDTEPIEKHVYIPELECFILLFHCGDYFHVRITRSGLLVFCFNTGLDIRHILTTFKRNNNEIYIVISFTTILLFDFNTIRILKVFKKDWEFQSISYNIKYDIFILMHELTSPELISINDFADFTGFNES